MEHLPNPEGGRVEDPPTPSISNRTSLSISLKNGDGNDVDDPSSAGGGDMSAPFLPSPGSGSGPGPGANTSTPGNSNSNDNPSSNPNREPRANQAAFRYHSPIRILLRKIGRYIVMATLVSMLVAIPVVIYEALIQRKLDVAAYDSAGVMVIGTLILSIRLVYLHFTHWHMPKVQKYVVRILWMVPLYAVQSWLSLYHRSERIYIDAIRDLYEAYVIASFLYYLIELLGGQESLIRILRHKLAVDPQAARHLSHHSFPLNFVMKPWELGLEFMLQCQHGVLQYVVTKAVATVITFIFQWFGRYGEGEFRWDSAYPYLSFILNMSVMYALYCLVKLFHAVADELRYPINWRPLGKFLCVKGVVFFTWWQGVVIFYLQSHGFIENIGDWTGDEVANGLIDYCICIEMVAFAIAHSYTFTHTEYLPETIQSAMANYEDGETANLRPSAARPSYHPPSVLPRPMTFSNALWNSSMPAETLHDIRRLRHGVEQAVDQANDPGIISMQDFQGEQDDADDDYNYDELGRRIV